MEEKPVRSTWMRIFTNHIRACIIIINAIIITLEGAILIYITPLLLNFPAGFTQLYRQYSLDYSVQVYISYLAAILIISILLFFFLKDVSRLKELQLKNDADSLGKLKQLRKKCMDAPYMIFWQQIASIMIPGVTYDLIFNYIFKSSWISFIKILIIIYSASTILATITFIFTKILFTKILVQISVYEDVKGRRVLLKAKVLTLVLPIFIAIVLFSFLFGYSRIIDQRGDYVFSEYSRLLERYVPADKRFNSPKEAFRALESLDVESSRICNFIITPTGKIITSDQSKLGNFFRSYLVQHKTSQIARIFSEDAEYNGAEVRIQGEDGIWYAGVHYVVISDEIQWSISLGCIILTALGGILSFLFIQTVSIDITEAGKNLFKVLRGVRTTSLQKIPITSNDEVGDIITAFNQIRAKDFEYDQLKTEFFANISHELRTPLSVLLATIQLLDKNLPANMNPQHEKSHKHLKIMQQNCHRLLRLVNNLIDSNKINAGYFQPRLKNRNIVEVAEEIVMSIVEYTRELGIELRFDTQAEEKRMAIDSDMIERILLNLISNAIKFSGKGSTILVSILDQGEQVVISVKDNGPGIPLEKQAIIFERFRQVDELLTRKHEGSGIGLSLVKGFVELLEGEISLSSEPGKGCDFLITLPVRLLPEEVGGECLENSDINEARMTKIHIEFSDLR